MRQSAPGDGKWNLVTTPQTTHTHERRMTAPESPGLGGQLRTRLVRKVRPVEGTCRRGQSSTQDNSPKFRSARVTLINVAYINSPWQPLTDCKLTCTSAQWATRESRGCGSDSMFNVGTMRRSWKTGRIRSFLTEQDNNRDGSVRTRPRSISACGDERQRVVIRY